MRFIANPTDLIGEEIKLRPANPAPAGGLPLCQAGFFRHGVDHFRWTLTVLPHASCRSLRAQSMAGRNSEVTRLKVSGLVPCTLSSRMASRCSLIRVSRAGPGL